MTAVWNIGSCLDDSDSWSVCLSFVNTECWQLSRISDGNIFLCPTGRCWGWKLEPSTMWVAYQYKRELVFQVSITVERRREESQVGLALISDLLMSPNPPLRLGMARSQET